MVSRLLPEVAQAEPGVAGWVIAVVTMLSGGGAGYWISAWQARKKVPAEVDSIIVMGAESAVTSLGASLVAETSRADRAELAVAERDEKIEALESKIDDLQHALNLLRDELHAIKRGVGVVESLIRGGVDGEGR